MRKNSARSSPKGMNLSPDDLRSHKKNVQSIRISPKNQAATVKRQNSAEVIETPQAQRRIRKNNSEKTFEENKKTTKKLIEPVTKLPKNIFEEKQYHDILTQLEMDLRSNNPEDGK